MSRPKAWNGTAWVDPSFWTGTEYKTYLPPTYSIPVWAWDWVSGDALGWQDQSGGNSGNPPPVADGAMILNGENNAGIWGYNARAAYQETYTTQHEMDPARRYRIQTRFRIVATQGAVFQDGTNMPIIAEWPYAYDLGTTPKIDHRYYPPVGASDTGFVTVDTSLIELSDTYSTYMVKGQIGSSQWFSTPHIIYVDYFRIMDDLGRPAYALSAPGWEPRVKRSDGTWQ